MGDNVLELLLCVLVAIGCVLVWSAAALAAWAWRRTRQRRRLRLVVPETRRVRRFLAPCRTVARTSSPRQRRAQVTYLRCINGGADLAESHRQSAPIALDKQSRRR